MEPTCPASGHVTCDDFSSQERLSGSSRWPVSRHDTRPHVPRYHSSVRHAHQLTHTCVVATSPKRMSYVAHPSSRRMRFQLVPCGRKQKQRLRRKERSHGKFSSDAAFFWAGAQTQGTNVISLGRAALHMTTAAAGRRQARLDRDQHAAAFFQGKEDPTPLPMLIILSQRYHMPRGALQFATMEW